MHKQLEGQRKRISTSEREWTSQLTEVKARCRELQQALDRERSIRQQTEEDIHKKETELKEIKLKVPLF